MPRPVTLGFHCSHEQHAPDALLRIARYAADAGFRAAMCSDHFHPWTDRQGHSGATWTWLGAALESTPLSFGTVCAPGQRYHPAVVAQASATLAIMYPGRFWLAIGSGESLNESITGDPWPTKADREARLKASADVMRALWQGQTVTTEGPVRTREARLYDVPARPPLIVGAALSEATARWLAPWVDALVTVAGPRTGMTAVVNAFREAGGASKPMFLQVALSHASTDAQSRDAALDQWCFCALPATALADLRTPAEFEAASAGARREDVLARVRASADIERQLDWLREDAEMGFERIYLHNVAREHQHQFIDAVAARIGGGLVFDPSEA